MMKSGQDLDAADLKQLLARLHQNEEQAWQEYDKLRQKLVMFFEPHFEAPELAEEVLDRIAKKSDSYPISNVAEFAFGVARNLRKEALHKASSLVYPVDADRLASTQETVEANFLESRDVALRRACFQRCLQQLKPGDRQLILSYYPPDDENLEIHRRKLAETTGMNWGALRTRVVRLRNRLAECCTQRYLQGISKPKAGRRFMKEQH